MTETSAPSPAPVEPAAAQPKPKTSLHRANLPDLIATQLAYTGPAIRHLEQTFQAHLQQHPGTNAVAEVAHYGAICEWCRANPDQAARVVMASIYLANGSFMVQVEDEVPEAPPAAPTPEPAQAT